MIKFYNYTKKMEHDQRYDIFSTWDIKRSMESATNTENNKIDEDMIDMSDIGEQSI